MRVGIDLRPLQNDHRFRGIGFYLSSLLKALAESKPADVDFVFFRWPATNPLKDLGIAIEGQEVLLPEPAKSVIADKLLNIFVRRFKAENIDVFFQPDAAYGRIAGATPTVGVLYDLIELKFRGNYFPRSPARLLKELGPKHALGNLIRYRLLRWQLNELSKCQLIIAISESAKADFLEAFKIAPENVPVVPLAYDSSIYNERAKAATKDATKPYLIYSGGADFRKNITAAIDAFDAQRAAGKDLQLLLVGKDFGETGVREHAGMWRRIAASPHSADILPLGFVESGELAGLLRSALAMLFPSRYEGFGMPPLEAMACGCPVVAYDNSSIPEVVGGAAMLVPDGESMAPALSELLEDEALRAALVAKGLERAKRFSWIETANQTLAVWKEAADASIR